MSDARKPPVAMESREPHSIRYAPSEWTEIREMARERGEEPSRLARKLTMYGLKIARAQAAAEAHTGMLGARFA